MNWRMTSQSKLIAQRLQKGESAVSLAREYKITRDRVYKIFREYSKHCLFGFEYADAMKSPYPIREMKRLLNAQYVYSFPGVDFDSIAV